MKIVAAALLLLTSCALAQLPDCSVPSSVGVNIHFTDPAPGEMNMLADAGFKWVRMDFSWQAIEKQPGQYDFSAYDRLLAALDQQHMRAVLILDYSNKRYDNDESPRSDEAIAAFAKWAAASATHFKGRGVIWEMYNEPNIQFWRPRPDVKQYIKLALATGKAIKSAAPDELFVGPALSGFDGAFIEACFQAGLLQYWDAVSVHPYGEDVPESRAASYRTLRFLIDQYKPKNKTIPILSGEWGYSSIWPGMSEALQAKYLSREFLFNLSQQIPLSIWYDWHDDGPDIGEPEHHFGTIKFKSREPKPAYLAAKTLMTQLNGFSFNKRLALDDPGDFLLLFTKGDAVRAVVWTTSHEPRKLILPASPGRFAVTSHVGEPLSKLTAGKDGLPITLTDAPQYLAPEQPNDLLRIAAAWERLPLEIVTQWPAHALARPAMTNPLDREIIVWRQNRSRNTILPRRLDRDAILFDTLRQPGASARRVEYTIQGIGRIAQTTDVMVSNPLIVTPMPPIKDSQPVRVENPTGERTDLLVRRADEDGGGSPLRFATNEISKLVELPGNRTGAIEIYSSDGAQLEATARACRFVPVSLDPRDFELRAEGDASVKSSQSLTEAAPPNPPLNFERAMRIDYDFADGWKYVRLSPRGAARKIDGKPLALGLWIKGDGSGNIPRLRFVDSTGQTFQPDGPRLSSTDWQYVSFPLGAITSHWGGANDDVVHYPIQLDAVILIDSAVRHATHGQIWIAAPSLVYAE